MPGECANHYTTGCTTAQGGVALSHFLFFSPFFPHAPGHQCLTSCLVLSSSLTAAEVLHQITRFRKEKSRQIYHPPLPDLRCSQTPHASHYKYIAVLGETHDSPIGEERSTTWQEGQNLSGLEPRPYSLWVNGRKQHPNYLALT